MISVAVSGQSTPPDSAKAPIYQRLKLSGRGGRLKGKGYILIAAAAPRSLSAIR